jgi:hypothetical protein
LASQLQPFAGAAAYERHEIAEQLGEEGVSS